MNYFLQAIAPPKAHELVKGVRVRIQFTTINELLISLHHLEKIIRQHQPIQLLLRIDYMPTLPDDVVKKAVKLHRKWQKKYLQYSTFIPICLDPKQKEIHQWTTPPDCDRCIFKEGQRCDGLIHHVSTNVKSWTHEVALSDWTANMSLENFISDPPCAYWMPQEHDLHLLQNYLIQYQCESIWDIGGSNGVIAYLIQSYTQIPVVVIDPLADLYTRVPSLERYACNDLEILQTLEKKEISAPSAILVSWPAPSMFYEEILHHTQAKLLILVDDQAGFCGVDQAYRQLHYQNGLVQCKAYPTIDILKSWSCVSQTSVTSYQDVKIWVKKGKKLDQLHHKPQGRLRIFVNNHHQSMISG